MTDYYDSSNVIQSVWSHYVIFGCSVFALGWGAVAAIRVKEIEIEERNIRHNPNTSHEEEDMPRSPAECKARMIETQEAI